MKHTHKIFFKYKLEGKESEHIFGKTLCALGTTHSSIGRTLHKCHWNATMYTMTWWIIIMRS